MILETFVISKMKNLNLILSSLSTAKTPPKVYLYHAFINRLFLKNQVDKYYLGNIQHCSKPFIIFCHCRPRSQEPPTLHPSSSNSLIPHTTRSNCTESTAYTRQNLASGRGVWLDPLPQALPHLTLNKCGKSTSLTIVTLVGTERGRAWQGQWCVIFTRTSTGFPPALWEALSPRGLTGGTCGSPGVSGVKKDSQKSQGIQGC